MPKSTSYAVPKWTRSITDLDSELEPGLTDAERAEAERLAALWNKLEQYRPKIYREMNNFGVGLRKPHDSQGEPADFDHIWTDIFHELLELGKSAEDVRWSYLKLIVRRRSQDYFGIVNRESVHAKKRSRLRYVNQKYGETLQFDSEDQKQELLCGINLKRLSTPIKKMYDEKRKKEKDAKFLSHHNLEIAEGTKVSIMISEHPPMIVNESFCDETYDVNILLQTSETRELRGLSAERNMIGRAYYDDDSGESEEVLIDTNIPSENRRAFLKCLMDRSGLTNKTHREMFIDSLEGIEKEKLVNRYDMTNKGVEKTLLRTRLKIKEFVETLPESSQREVYDVIVYLVESRGGVPITALKSAYVNHQQIGRFYKEL